FTVKECNRAKQATLAVIPFSYGRRLLRPETYRPRNDSFCNSGPSPARVILRRPDLWVDAGIHSRATTTDRAFTKDSNSEAIPNRNKVYGKVPFRGFRG